MALFSFFAKKNKQPEPPVEIMNTPPVDPQHEPAPLPVDVAAERDASHLRMQRDAARMTAEKIDAIESEITRDILKNPAPAADPMEDADSEQNPVPEEEDVNSANPFHTTLVRVDKETRILFRDEMDE